MKTAVVPITPDLSHVMDKWRYAVLLKQLPALGHDIEIYRPGVRYNAVILPLMPHNKALFAGLRAAGVPIIGDITDNHLTFPYANYNMLGRLYYAAKYTLAKEGFGLFRDMLRGCRAVVAGSQAQCDIFSAFNPHVSAVTDAVTDDIIAHPARNQDTSVCRLLWFGHVASLHGFKSMGTTLNALGRQGGFELVLVTADYVQGRYLGRHPRTVKEFMAGQTIPCTHVPWSYAALLKTAQTCHIGLVPADTRNSFVISKPAGRALLMMGMGLPVAAQDTDSHRRAIAHGQNGFLAAAPQDWADIISALKNNPAQGSQIGLAARQTVIGQYSEAVFARKYLEVIKETLKPA